MRADGFGDSHGEHRVTADGFGDSHGEHHVRADGFGDGRGGDPGGRAGTRHGRDARVPHERSGRS